MRLWSLLLSLSFPSWKMKIVSDPYMAVAVRGKEGVLKGPAGGLAYNRGSMYSFE